MGGALARRRLEKNCALGRQRTQAGGGASGRAQCGIRVQKRGGSGLYRVRGKVGGRQTREIGHSLARPPAGLPSPRDLHTMEHPQTPFTPDSSYLFGRHFGQRCSSCFYCSQLPCFSFHSHLLILLHLQQKRFGHWLLIQPNILGTQHIASRGVK